MKTSKMKESKFLTKEEVTPSVLVTMAEVEKVNMSLDEDKPDYKWCLHFNELDKPLVLNQTNISLINAVTGTDDTDDWVGKKVVLYFDPSIMFKGSVKGGIRVRGNQAVQAPVVPNQRTFGHTTAPAPEFQVENKDNEADFLMTYNALPKPTAAQIANIRKICVGVWNDPKCEIKNRLAIYEFFNNKWPDTEDEVAHAIELSCLPF